MPRVVELPPADGLRPDGTLSGGWWHESDEPGRIVCDLCPRACALRPGDRGFCFVRENRGGDMVLSTYGRSTGFCIDPIEKKPLNHFYPGSSVLSFGTAGCNLGCKFCQNWSISKSREIEQLSETASPEAIAEAARQLGCKSVAFTYNDPVVWAEYAIDAARACRAAGIRTVAVTAGYITPQARRPFYEVMDAANVDLKGFTEEFYRHLALSHLEPVLDTLRWLKHESDVWFEITNLVIPRANDSLDEIRQMCQWILDNLGPDVPLHFTAFHPDFRLTDRPRTPSETLLAAYEAATSLGLKYVYVGNILAQRKQATYCPACRRPVVERSGYTLEGWHLNGNRCRSCGAEVAGRFEAQPGNWGSRRMPVRISSYAPARPAPATHAITMTTPAIPASPPPADYRPAWTADQERAVLQAASRFVAAAAAGQDLPAADLRGAAEQLVLGAFVSLKRQGRLRSCCGCLGKPLPLEEVLRRAAERTTNDDHRFPLVSLSELPFLDMEVWLLHGLKPVQERGQARREAVTIGLHGLQIARGASQGLLLPGVAVEQGFDAEQFLQQVCAKAGLPVTAWQEDDAALWTFEGHAIRGPLGEALSELPPPAALRFTPADLSALAEFCRANLSAFVQGATPNYYAFGAADGNVHGVAVSLAGPDGREWLSSSRISLRQALPLQSTLYSLAEGMARTLAGSQFAARLDQARLRLLVLADPAMHGAADDADLRGFDPGKRAIAVLEGGKSAVVFDPDRASADVLDEAIRQAQVRTPAAASVFSMAAMCTAPQMTVTQVPRPQAGPAVRPAALAGRFYPADAGELGLLVDNLLAGPPCQREPWPAVMVPHAGLTFSGRIAADVLRRVEIPETVVVLGPKHTPYGVEWSVAPHATWSIPGAEIPSDPALARELAQTIAGLELDAAAHQQEHAIEVELPFLARLAPTSRVVGIAMGGGTLARCLEFAAGLARVLAPRKERTLLVISSDMNHFAPDAENRRLDEMALAAFERLDPAALHETVTRNHISMCGLLPAVVVLETLRLWGNLSRSRRVGYATSADAGGDPARVVGYAGMLVG